MQRHGARQDLTALCPSCATRVAGTAPRCPTCHGPVASLHGGIASVPPAVLEATTTDAAPWWFLWPPTRSEAPTVTLLRPAPLPETTRFSAVTRVEGIVRALEGTPSPLGGRVCVAARLRGRVENVDVDDAVLVDFEVETAAGERVGVPDGPATIALETPEPWTFDSCTEPLLAFLRERGLRDGDVKDIHLAEAVLCDGDPVVVEGFVEERTDAPTDYRKSALRRTLHEAPGVVRVIRRA